MAKHGRTDLKYGILIRNIPSDCETLIARLIDVGGNIATSSPFPVPNQMSVTKICGTRSGAAFGEQREVNALAPSAIIGRLSHRCVTGER